jgi:hypothetical protein
MPRIDIEPIWGNGWTDGDQTREPPAPFSVNAQECGVDSWQGVVITRDHEFEGQSIKFSARFTNFFRGAVAITITGEAATSQVFGDGLIGSRG